MFHSALSNALILVGVFNCIFAYAHLLNDFSFFFFLMEDLSSL